MTEIYRQEDVQQILQIAIARQVDNGELTRAELVEIASELGISALDLDRAEQEWLLLQGEQQERHAFNRYQQCKFRQHFVRYAIVNTFLILLDLVTGGGLGWSLYVVLGWGLGVALNAWKAYQTDGVDYEEAFSKWRRKRQFKRSVGTLLDRWLKG